MQQDALPCTKRRKIESMEVKESDCDEDVCKWITEAEWKQNGVCEESVVDLCSSSEEEMVEVEGHVDGARKIAKKEVSKDGSVSSAALEGMVLEHETASLPLESENIKNSEEKPVSTTVNFLDLKEQTLFEDFVECPVFLMGKKMQYKGTARCPVHRRWVTLFFYSPSSGCVMCVKPSPKSQRKYVNVSLPLKRWYRIEGGFLKRDDGRKYCVVNEQTRIISVDNMRSVPDFREMLEKNDFARRVIKDFHWIQSLRKCELIRRVQVC